MDYAFYSLADGRFSGQTLTLIPPRPEALEANTPPGHAAIEGVYDPAAQRVDLETGAVVPVAG